MIVVCRRAYAEQTTIKKQRREERQLPPIPANQESSDATTEVYEDIDMEAYRYDVPNPELNPSGGYEDLKRPESAYSRSLPAPGDATSDREYSRQLPDPDLYLHPDTSDPKLAYSRGLPSSRDPGQDSNHETPNPRSAYSTGLPSLTDAGKDSHHATLNPKSAYSRALPR